MTKFLFNGTKSLFGQSSSAVDDDYGSERKLVGLFNPSNYCFANVCLQILYHIEELRHYFIRKLYRTHISSKRRLKVLRVFVDIINKLTDTSNEFISAQGILGAMGQEFLNGFIHHDSFEFLLGLLDNLDEELNRMRSDLLLYSVKKDCSKKEEDVSNPLRTVVEKGWNSFCENKASLIKLLFYGSECSIVTCANCSRVSYTTEPSMMYSLALPQKIIRVYFMKLSLSSPIETLEVAVECCEEGVLVESVTYQLSLIFKIPISTIELCHLTEDHNSLILLSLSQRIHPWLKLLAFEVANDARAYFILDIKCTNRLLSPSFDFCNSCFRRSAVLKKCSDCLKVAYCDKNCQVRDWNSGHKISCSSWKNPNSVLDVGFPIFVSLKEEDVSSMTVDSLKHLCLNNAKRFIVFNKQLTNSSSQESIEEVDGLNGHVGYSSQTSSELFQDIECCSEEEDVLNTQLQKEEVFEALVYEVTDFDRMGNCFRRNNSLNSKMVESAAHHQCAIHSRNILIPKTIKVSLITKILQEQIDTDDTRNSPRVNGPQSKGGAAFGSKYVHVDLLAQNLDKKSWKESIVSLLTGDKVVHLNLVLSSITKEDKFDKNDVDVAVESSPSSSFSPGPVSAPLLSYHDNWVVVKSVTDRDLVTIVDCKRVTLHQCLLSHFSPIRVTGRSCDYCKEKCDSIKSSYTWTLPNYLFIHFKRAAEFQNISKLLTTVEFPLDNLDFSPFFATGQETSESYHNKYHYRLHSLVQHHGRSQVKGHYTCYIRLPATGSRSSTSSSAHTNSDDDDDNDGNSCAWYHFDDEKIVQVPARYVSRAEPYYLVYENIAISAKNNLFSILHKLN